MSAAKLSKRRYLQLLRRFRRAICGLHVDDKQHAELQRILSILEGQDPSWVDQLVEYVKDNNELISR